MTGVGSARNAAFVRLRNLSRHRATHLYKCVVPTAEETHIRTNAGFPLTEKRKFV